MSEHFVGEIRMVGFNFAPRGWAFCDGKLMPISQNQSLWNLLGTMYGGDGSRSFCLPDIRGRTPIHRYVRVGKMSGFERHTLNQNEMPSHTHDVSVSNSEADKADSDDHYFGESNGGNIYANGQDTVNLKDDSISYSGSFRSHDNMQPYLVINYCIALDGVYPPKS